MQTRTTGPAEVVSDLPPGFFVGEYRVDQLIGRGGFGTVYRATHPVIGKQVAIKVLARKYSADPDVVSRFVAEAKAVNQIRHRNIIDIFAFGALEDGRQYYVMEYLDGEPFDVHLARHGAMTLTEALPILRAIARALDAAHAKGIAHRDLKPENIFLAHDPDAGYYPKLLDFGIAKLLAPEEDVRHRTGTGVPIGTPYYMSPEQCRGRDVDHRTDIYSFGVVAYRVLTGTYPFEGEDYLELMNKHASAEPAPPSQRNPQLTAAVDQAIAWMMQKRPEDRPKTVLDGVVAMDPSQVTPPMIARGSRPAVGGGATTTDPFAKTTAEGEGAPPKRRRRGKLLLVPVAMALGAVITWQVLAHRDDEPVKTSAKPAVTAAAPPPAPAPPPPPSPPPPQPAASPQVAITLLGIPANTHVEWFLDGTDRGIVDTKHPLAIDRGDRDVVLALRAKGYADIERKIRPDRDQTLGLTFVKSRTSPAHHDSSADPHGVINSGDIFR